MVSPKKEIELNWRSRAKRDWARNQIKQYKDNYEKYARCAEKLQEVLSCAAKEIAPASIVQTRPKSIASFGEKIWRLRNDYDDPVNQFWDLCAGRVITHTQNEVDAICEFVRNKFDVDAKNSGDVCHKLSPAEFGYRAFHFVVRFKPGIYFAESDKGENPFDLSNLKMEIQVKTLLAHAWSEFSHDRTYKSSFKIPWKYERALDAVSASLESADQALSAIHDGLQEYASSYDSYMKKSAMPEEIRKLEIIMEFEPNNLEVAHRIGKIARNLEDWEKVISTLSKFAGSDYPPILRDLGVALCKHNERSPQSDAYKLGQSYLLKAAETPKPDPDALCSLAGTWKGINDDKAKELYYRAFEFDPSDSYALGNIINYELARTHDLSILRLARPTIEAAILRCRSQIEVNVNLPWAYFDVGKFNLLMGRTSESISAYAKAVQLSPSQWMIRTSLDGLEKNIGEIKDEIAGYEWVVRLLALGQLSKSGGGAKKKHAVESIKVHFPNLGKLASPTVILVGGCSEKAEAVIQKYRGIIHEAFAGFRCTIVSGGTTSGVSGLAAELTEANSPSVQTFGYVPKNLPDTASIDRRYSGIRQTDGDDFSPLEPLQYWADILTSNVKPSRVRLLGIGGGKIAAAEYRIALALGAKVAVIEESEGAAADLFLDQDWADSKNLARIPPERTALRSFLNK